LKNYKQLRFVDLQENAIDDLSALQVAHLLTLDISQNRLKSLSTLGTGPYLHSLKVVGNRLSSLAECTSQQKVLEVDLSENPLTNLSGIAAWPALQSLIARKTKLEDLKPLATGCRQLRVVHLEGSAVASLAGLPLSLEEAYLDENQIKTLEHVEGLKSLKLLSLKQNGIEGAGELDRLRELLLLKEVDLTENPIAEIEEFRSEVLIRVGDVRHAQRRLVKLNGERATREDRDGARALVKQRKEEEEERRRQAEEEAAAGKEGEGEGEGEED
jgi:Leucine-rich repeat (LRR) protein